MKLINFSFICALIFMIEYPFIISDISPLDTDKTHEPEPDKEHYIRIKYASNIIINWKGSGTTEPANGETLLAGKELKITLTSDTAGTINPVSFFKNNDNNYKEIKFIDLSNLHSNLTL